MTPDDLEPLSPAARELLAAERGADAPADSLAAQRERVYSRLSATLGFAAVAAGVAATAAANAALQSGGASAASGSAAAAQSGAQTAASVARGGALKLFLGSKVALAVAAATSSALVAASGVYVGMSRKVERLEERVRIAERARAEQALKPPSAPDEPPAAAPVAPAPVAAPPPMAPSPAVRARALSQAEPRPAPRPAAASANPAPPSPDDALAAENALLNQARMELLRGNPEAALSTLEEHQRAHPAGRLGEERDALRVQALAQLGRRDEAQTAAAAFRVRYPGSLLQPSVDAALGKQP